MRIYVIGFMGVGKTHWGKIWAEAMGMDFYDLDTMIEEKEGKLIDEIFAEKGETYFREKERDFLLQTASYDHAVIACGGGTPCFYDQMNWMNEQGTTVYIQATSDQILSRLVTEQAKRPLIRDLNLYDLEQFIESRHRTRASFYRHAHITLGVNSLHPAILKPYLEKNNAENA